MIHTELLAKENYKMKYIIILLLFLPQILLAKCYVINDLKIECVKGFTPKGNLKAVPKDENGKDVLNINDIDITGGIASYNQSKRTARLAADQLIRDNRDIKETQFEDIRAELRSTINNIDSANIIELRTAVKKILRLMLRELD